MDQTKQMILKFILTAIVFLFFGMMLTSDSDNIAKFSIIILTVVSLVIGYLFNL